MAHFENEIKNLLSCFSGNLWLLNCSENLKQYWTEIEKEECCTRENMAFMAIASSHLLFLWLSYIDCK